MSFAQDEEGWWSLTCDVCLDGWYGWDGDLRFSSRADLEAVAGACGWALGSAVQICAVCGLAACCAQAGHRWGGWINLEASPLLPEPGHRRARFCTLCGAGDYADSSAVHS